MSQTFASCSVSIAVMRGDAVTTAGPHPPVLAALCSLARSLCSPAMLATYGSLLLILVASCLVGQALLALCGRRDWSWLAPAIGLALLTAVAWGTVRLPGNGIASAIAIGGLAVASLAYLRGRLAGLREAASVGVPVAALALLAASLPFIVEHRLGILGTGLDPDMSQHLYAADQLAHGH